MTKTKYFVIRNHFSNGENSALVISVSDELTMARAKAEEYAMNNPGVRYMIAAEMQSIVGQVQVNWSDK